jgi:twitching motility protein PilT
MSMDLADLLLFAQKSKASDLHISAGNPPIMRVSGEMRVQKLPPLSAEQMKELIYSIMTDQQRSDYERDLEVDFAISIGEHSRFRVNAFNTLGGPAAVLRTIPTEIKSLEDLKAPDIFKRLTQLHKGLILVTGPTGSGKSTTLAAMVDHINSNEAKHILTVEDPVEFVHKSKKSLINQREVGRQTRSFARALKSALREDPDVILVGELRDLETIQLALTAAETGHLVMATLHTSSAPKTIDRIIDVFPGHDKDMVRAMLSVSLEAVIAQTLLPRIGGGRVAAHEILLGTGAIRNLIREGRIPQIHSLMQISSKMGMCIMKDSIQKLVDEGVVSAETAAEAMASGSSAGSEDESHNPGNGNAPAAPGKPTGKPVPVTAAAKPVFKNTSDF